MGLSLGQTPGQTQAVTQDPTGLGAGALGPQQDPESVRKGASAAEKGFG